MECSKVVTFFVIKKRSCLYIFFVRDHIGGSEKTEISNIDDFHVLTNHTPVHIQTTPLNKNVDVKQAGK